jgi:hypothetical protein
LCFIIGTGPSCFCYFASWSISFSRIKNSSTAAASAFFDQKVYYGLWTADGAAGQSTSSSRRSPAAPAVERGGRESRRLSIASTPTTGIIGTADLQRCGGTPVCEVEVGWACANERHATPARLGDAGATASRVLCALL